jgi:hypothetical protein
LDYAKIAKGLRLIADALETGVASLPSPTPASSSYAPCYVDAPTYDLARLQELGRDLVKKDKAALKSVLKDFDLANVSSAPEDKWPALGAALTKALG